MSLEDVRQLPGRFDRVYPWTDPLSNQKHCQSNAGQMNSKQRERFPSPDHENPANPDGKEKNPHRRKEDSQLLDPRTVSPKGNAKPSANTQQACR